MRIKRILIIVLVLFIILLGLNLVSRVRCDYLDIDLYDSQSTALYEDEVLEWEFSARRIDDSMYANITTKQWFDIELDVIKLGFRDAYAKAIPYQGGTDLVVFVIKKSGRTPAQLASDADDVIYMIKTKYTSLLPVDASVQVYFREKSLNA